MDLYTSSTDYFRIDDLLDFSNDDLFSSSSSASTAVADHHLSPPGTIHSSTPLTHPSISSDFTDQLSIPSDDAAELEWLSQFVDDSFINFPPNLLTGTINVRSDTSFASSKARSKRCRAATTNATWISAPESTTVKSKSKRESNSSRASSPTAGGVRRCTHCASEKTPQWRTGPLGPKTLCNACGVRFKSGRLVPEYRPAASPTFVLTQHSNSHRKVLELRRQKEMSKQQEGPRSYHHHHHRHHQQDFEVC